MLEQACGSLLCQGCHGEKQMASTENAQTQISPQNAPFGPRKSSVRVEGLHRIQATCQSRQTAGKKVRAVRLKSLLPRFPSYINDVQ